MDSIPQVPFEPVDIRNIPDEELDDILGGASPAVEKF
jgi:hypothetical protein